MKPNPQKTGPALQDVLRGEGLYRDIYRAVCRIPHGRVATYGQIALLCGHPRAARVVGRALHQNPCPGEIPCHRVVDRTGRLAPAFAFGGAGRQRELLEAEGVAFDAQGNAVLSLCQWDGCADGTRL